MTRLDRLLRVVGVLCVVPAFVLFAVAILVHASASGFAYVAGFFALAIGLAFQGSPRGRRGLVAGAAILAGTLSIRACAGAAGATVSMTGPDGTRSARLLGRIVDEGDAAVPVAYGLSLIGRLPDPEATIIPSRMRDAYARLRAAEGMTPSPVLPTYAGLESAETFDVLVVDGVPEPRGALIFLHGFAGGFTLPCWQIAQMARPAGLVTLCPSMGWRGEWWTATGEATLRRTIDLARARGLDRIVLAGLSNGAVGASVYAPRMRGALRGLVLISCASASAGAAGVPTLVLHGRGDRMCPAAAGRAYAQRTGARYVELDAGHFALMTHEEEAARALGDWLSLTLGSR
jgi:pimeloyl-ACP methyl ester carboxylesterase